MKINGNLEVQGLCDIRLRKFYEEIPENLKKAGRVFVNEDNRLCIVDENLNILEFSLLSDADYSDLFGPLITRSKKLNSSKIRQEMSMTSLESTSTLYDLLQMISERSKRVEDELLSILQKKTGVSIDKPFLKFNAASGKLEAVQIEFDVPTEPESAVPVRQVKEIQCPLLKRIHLVKHNTGNRFCIVQVIDMKSGVSISPASYEVEFSDENLLVVKLSQERQIVVLVS